MATDSAEKKQVSLLLGIGIFLVPFIFSWFTLQKGFSFRAKIISIGWLIGFIVLGIIGNHLPQPIQQQSTTPTPTASTYFKPGELKTEAEIKKEAESLEETTRKTKLETFITTLRKVDPKGNILISAKYGELLRGEAVITVGDQWHYDTYQLRLQIAQDIESSWAHIYGDKARIKLLDKNGNEVGGTKMLGGVWVQNK